MDPLRPSFPKLKFTHSRLEKRLKPSVQKQFKSKTPPLFIVRKSHLPLTNHQPQVTTKPLLPDYPPIWAQSRQEVCESFEWFRSYQGGVYYSNSLVKGYLLGAFPAERDAFFHKGKLIISHGGGKAESLSVIRGRPQVRFAEDQDAGDLSIRALLNNYSQQIPLVLLIDEKYQHFPYKFPESGTIGYAILGLYTITHVWQEFEEKTTGRVVRFKFAFQWCEDQGPPWWWWKRTRRKTSKPKPQPKNAPPFLRSMPVKKKETKMSKIQPADWSLTSSSCAHCGKSSPQVFSIGWACLHSECPRFWTLSGGSELSSSLKYHKPFLRLKSTAPLKGELRDIRPPIPVTNPSDKVTTIHAYSRGLHCRKCGRLSCRSKWERWECANCHARLDVHGRTRMAGELRGIDIKVAFDFLECKIAEGSSMSPVILMLAVIHKTMTEGIMKTGYKPFQQNPTHGSCRTFVLPDGKGFIHHIRNKIYKLREADEIFEVYQRQAASGALPFRRFPLQNAGPIVLRIRGALLTNYFSHNCGEPYKYVGGTNNTVSWEDAPEAVVRAREYIQGRIELALGEKKIFNEVLSAAYMERQKMGYHTDDERGLGPTVAGLSLGSPALMHFRSADKQSARSVVLSLVLRHGDVLVMDGDGVQKYYEHTVAPVNFRIAATARWIDPASHK
ncbi:hypothetical protein D9758_001831 [Tetrapyrgos nigripes]|uniref:Alpha-ketoglutarate-dependent dioxygenase AlkB-like domain-containing protein n=1 Tax=Tetrapyrgos nigripes TaxID=182062 RepID=A0A8H5LVB6_9AGAR|nr:hypothetical protein D9758_001831 [Tetrapyrgos nigripes]